MSEVSNASHTVTNWIRARRDPKRIYPVSKPLVCADGFQISVQASSNHYCSPREDRGPWSEFELGFPSSTEELILDYAEEPSKPTETVYGWVPARVVLDVITKHGGLKTT